MTPAIKLTTISKRYYLHPDKPTLVENLNPFKIATEFWALKNINLMIGRGERVGIMGPNGSGKTTLLKIIAGITRPTTGTVETHGRIVSLIELTAGFHPEMNGIENIYLNGLLLGLTRKYIQSELQNIITYADIGDFIHQPTYTYSSGMLLRLGFAIAIHANPQILLLDENLSVGDQAFSRKIETTITKTLGSITLVVASHDQSLIKKFCTRVIQLHKM